MQAADVASSTEALTRLRSAAVAPFDLAIIDQNIADIDAFSLAQRIHALPALAHIQLLLLSNFDERDQGERALHADFAAFLSKPIKQSHLFDAIATTYDQPVILRDLPASVQTNDGRSTSSEYVILLVEDNPTNQRVAQAQLEMMGYPVHTVASGQAALDAVMQNETSFGAILMDVQMPVMDGLATTRAIRKSERTSGRHTPIIATTANAMEGDRETCLAAGMDDYLSKPLHAERLRQALSRWVPVSAAERQDQS
jgi:CheY-like chemotaxis protein